MIDSFKKFKSQPDGSVFVRIYKEGSNLYLIFESAIQDLGLQVQNVLTDATSLIYQVSGFENNPGLKVKLEQLFWRWSSNLQVLDNPDTILQAKLAKESTNIMSVKNDLVELMKLAGLSKASVLKEGTWSYPDNMTKVNKLKQMMSKPIKASLATTLLYDLIGDDSLFDAIDEISQHYGDDDIRPLIRLHLAKIIKDKDLYINGFQPGVLDELKAMSDHINEDSHSEDCTCEECVDKSSMEYDDDKETLTEEHAVTIALDNAIATLTKASNLLKSNVTGDGTVRNKDQVAKAKRAILSVQPALNTYLTMPMFESKELTEDWGSSDWSALFNFMKHSIQQNGRTTKEAALDAAEFYYDHMGYDSPEDAMRRIIKMWNLRNEMGIEGFNEPIEEEVDHTKPANSPNQQRYDQRAYDFKGRSSLPNRYVQARYSDNPLKNAKQIASESEDKIRNAVASHITPDKDDPIVARNAKNAKKKEAKESIDTLESELDAFLAEANEEKKYVIYVKDADGSERKGGTVDAKNEGHAKQIAKRQGIKNITSVELSESKGEYYVDKEGDDWAVFHTDKGNGKAYGLHATKAQAEKDAAKRNGKIEEGAGLKRAVAATKASRGEKLTAKDKKDLDADTLAHRMQKGSSKKKIDEADPKNFKPGLTVITRSMYVPTDEEWAKLKAVKWPIGISVRFDENNRHVEFKTAKMKTVAKILDKIIDFDATSVGDVLDLPPELNPSFDRDYKHRY